MKNGWLGSTLGVAIVAMGCSGDSVSAGPTAKDATVLRDLDATANQGRDTAASATDAAQNIDAKGSTAPTHGDSNEASLDSDAGVFATSDSSTLDSASECVLPETCASASGCPDCPPGEQLCGKSCIESAHYKDNCGSCGHACAADEACVSGTCRAEASLSVVSGRDGPTLLAVDDVAVYWFEPGTLSFYKAQKSNWVPTVLGTAPTDPADFAVGDTDLFWTSGTSNAVYRLDKTNGGAPQLIASAATPKGIAVDEGALYWCELRATVRYVLSSGSTSHLTEDGCATMQLRGEKLYTENDEMTSPGGPGGQLLVLDKNTGAVLDTYPRYGTEDLSHALQIGIADNAIWYTQESPNFEWLHVATSSQASDSRVIAGFQQERPIRQMLGVGCTVYWNTLSDHSTGAIVRAAGPAIYEVLYSGGTITWMVADATHIYWTHATGIARVSL